MLDNVYILALISYLLLLRSRGRIIGIMITAPDRNASSRHLFLDSLALLHLVQFDPLLILSCRFLILRKQLLLQCCPPFRGSPHAQRRALHATASSPPPSCRVVDLVSEAENRAPLLPQALERALAILGSEPSRWVGLHQVRGRQKLVQALLVIERHPAARCRA